MPKRGCSPVETSPVLPVSSGPSNMGWERNREEGPGNGESVEVSSDSKGKNSVVLSYREKPHSGMGRQGVKGLGS